MNQLLHEDAEKIVSAGIHAVLPDVAVIRALESYDFGTGGGYLVAAGKAAWQMAHAAVSCLGGRIRRGSLYGLQKPRVATARRFAEQISAVKFRRRHSARREQVQLRGGFSFFFIKARNAAFQGRTGRKWIQNHGQAAFPVI